MKFAKPIASLTLALLIAQGCQNAKLARESKAREAHLASPGLHISQAQERAKQVGKVQYQLWFRFNEESSRFEGRTTVHFERKGKDQWRRGIPLLLDFNDGKIKSLSINNKNVPESEIAEIFAPGIGFKIPDNLFSSSGSQSIEISYESPFSPMGNGIYRFKDPEDSLVYIYTNLEPYHAHHVFPCFDQPDLKASYEVTVEAPASWNVIANTLEREKSKVDGLVSWQFPATSVFSTYVFMLAAGPYFNYSKLHVGAEKTIPMRLFARQSLKRYLPKSEAEEWFKISSAGFKFFEEYFATPYPYAKYDQVLVPDFTSGAMENVAAVTFREYFLFRSAPTLAQKIIRAETILHEMVHMWFGDLVTMKWWNGLWLNESFATFFSKLALYRTGLFSEKDVRLSYYVGQSRALIADRKPTTHPIDSYVENTSSAFAQFDLITYEKGASALGQLHELLGDEDLKEGLYRYFKKYAYKNTTLDDFLSTLTQASDKSLSTFRKDWLETQGPNTFTATAVCGEDQTLQAIEVSQGFKGPMNQPRMHKIGFATEKGQIDGMYTVVGAKSLVSFAENKPKIPCPKLVVADSKLSSYGRQNLSPESLKNLSAVFGKIQDPLIRTQIWAGLWNAFEDGTLSPAECKRLIEQFLGDEMDPFVVRSILRNLLPNGGGVSLFAVLPKNPLPHWAQWAWQNILKHKGRTDVQKAWVQFYLKTVEGKKAGEELLQYAQSIKKIPGYSMQNPEQWSFTINAARLGAIDPVWLEKLKAGSDQSYAEEMMYRLRAANEAEDSWANSVLVGTESINDTHLLAVAEMYLDHRQTARQEKWRSTFFEQLDRISKVNSEDEFLSDWLGSLIPTVGTNEQFLAYEKKAEKAQSNAIRKVWKEAAFLENELSQLKQSK